MLSNLFVTFLLHPENMEETFRCAQCSLLFNSKSARKLHVRSTHQTHIRLTDAHGSTFTVEKLNGLFTCPIQACPYTTNKAGLMQSHYSRCRFRIRQSIPQIPQASSSVGTRGPIPGRVFPPQEEVQGQSPQYFGEELQFTYFLFSLFTEIPLLKEHQVMIQTRANIPICTNSNCFNGILPNELVSHLKKNHNISLPPGSLDFLELPNQPPQDIYQLDHPIAPFEGIWMYLGVVCKLCHYACVQMETMRKHFVKHHWGDGMFGNSCGLLGAC